MRWLGVGLVVLLGCTGEFRSAEGGRGDAALPDAGSVEGDGSVGADGDQCAEETCDGLDNDCDGRTDEALTMDCGSSVGACMPGIARCIDGAFEACVPVVASDAERCNGLDDDCDGQIDEALTVACGSSEGICLPGVARCVDGAFEACVPEVEAGSESCNGLDDDCDGTMDEALTQTCGSDVGRCRSGEVTCSDGAFPACAPQVGPRGERCDGVDDDCDGRTDESIARRRCGTDVGTCRRGWQTCGGGSWGSCAGSVGPRAERDDGLDNDCDGDVDEGLPCENSRGRQVRSATNGRRGSSRPALRCDHGLRRAAQAHAADMCRTGVFSHTSADGRVLQDRLREARATYRMAGENLAFGYESPSRVVTEWMNSPAHRANILNAGFRRIGVGYAACTGSRRHYYVQVFGN